MLRRSLAALFGLVRMVDRLLIEDGTYFVHEAGDEIVACGGLPEKNKLFIGSTAHKVLLALPVPMVVVPRDYVRINTSPED